MIKRSVFYDVDRCSASSSSSFTPTMSRTHNVALEGGCLNDRPVARRSGVSWRIRVHIRAQFWSPGLRPTWDLVPGKELHRVLHPHHAEIAATPRDAVVNGVAEQFLRLAGERGCYGWRNR
jgi:hypothetical protein